MKIAVFTLCKNRLEYTKLFMESLEAKTHIPFDHYILDQGSTDGTIKYLSNFKKKSGNLYLFPLPKNIGINRGFNFLLDKINNYDVITPLDNDALILTDAWLEKCIGVLRPKLLISPFVEGLIINRGGINRVGYDKESNIGFTPAIGGICMIGLAKTWKEDIGVLEFPTPYHSNMDMTVCFRLYLKGYKFGYKEDVIIRHLDTTLGQEKKYKDYFMLRKTIEKIKII